MFRWNFQTKRNLAMIVVGALGAIHTPILGDFVSGIANYDIMGGFTVNAALGIGALVVAFGIYKRAV